MIEPRNHNKTLHAYVNPEVPLNVGLWTLFAGATFFLALRLWIKVTRRHGMWWDDWLLVVTWIILAVNNSIISIQYATGYVVNKWDDRMQILINVTSCGTLIGQALSKTAFAATLLKLTEGWQKWVLWFCIITMNAYMIAKVILQWAKICDKKSYDVWYRLNFCVYWKFRDDFKEGGNVYNIIMDFVLATFPWLITWNLDIRKVEKIGLCVTMSLGMVVAIIAAIRTGWKDGGNPKDEWYFWRNAHSNVWFSSEIVGTIIVQCIPVLRPLLRDIRTSLTSKRLGSHADINQQRRKPRSLFNISSSHEATIFSDTKQNSSSNGPATDSWDNNGIYQKKEFELTTVETKNPTSSNSLTPDSWDSRGIYQKKSFELTTVESKQPTASSSPVAGSWDFGLTTVEAKQPRSEDSPSTDSWDNQGTHQKRDSELTAVESKQPTALNSPIADSWNFGLTTLGTKRNSETSPV